MNIVLCADEHYAMPCGICITSILENNRDCSCQIYVLTNGFSDKTKSLFIQLQEKYNQPINIVDIDSSIFKGLKVSERFRESIYYRFFIPDIVQGEKALYLDSDIIVNGSLRELWNIDLSDYACAVIEDQCGDDIRLHNRIEVYSAYFNSGVILMNLEYWRENSIKERLIDFIYNNPERCLYPDQDALNVVLADKVFFADYKFNFQDLMNSDEGDLMLHRSKWAKIQEAKKNPTVIHYTSWTKPWHLHYSGFFKDVFLYYKSLSPWNLTKLENKGPKLSEKICFQIRRVIKLLSFNS